MDNCIFCKIANGEIPSATIFEDENCRVIMDIGPASKGHAIMLAKKHVANIYETDAETAAKLYGNVPKIARGIQKTLGCEGMNILQNNGTAAGQTVFHLHIHFIPRNTGDAVNIGWTPGSYPDGEAMALAEDIKKNI